MNILIVEDEALVALDLTIQLERIGHAVLGPCRGSAQALALVAKREPDAAILDFALGGADTSEPVAADLARRGVPFVFLTGFASTDVIANGRFADRPRMSKPCSVPTLAAMLEAFERSE